MKIILLLLVTLTARAEALKDLSLDEALKAVACRPMTVSGQSAQTETFGQTEIGIEIGAEKFVRTDMGSPNGELRVLRSGKKICGLGISQLGSIEAVLGKILLLKSSSAEGSSWQIYDYSWECKPIGRAPPKISEAFGDALAKLGSCKK